MNVMEDFKLITFAEFLYESKLNEISINSTLYHRSPFKMNVGDIIQTNEKNANKAGFVALSDDYFEKLLEEYRKDVFPDKPSRLTSAFSSVIPRSRFSDRGNLYVVKIIGDYFMTNSIWIDEMRLAFNDHRFDDDVEQLDVINSEYKKIGKAFNETIAKKYWTGVSGSSKNDRGNIEIVSDQLEVVEVIKKKRSKVKKNVKRIVTESNKIYVDVKIWGGSNHWAEELNKFIIDNENGDDDWTEWSGFLKEGAIVKILDFSSSNSVDLLSDEVKGRYQSMTLMPIINGKLIKEHRHNNLLMTINFKKSNTYDISQFLK